jgi:hypothetical protein
MSSFLNEVVPQNHLINFGRDLEFNFFSSVTPFFLSDGLDDQIGDKQISRAPFAEDVRTQMFS